METNALLKEIDASDIGALHSTKSKQEEAFTQELVAQYLAHDGYIETAKAFMGEAKKLHQAIGSPTDNGVTRLLEYKDDQDAVNRQSKFLPLLTECLPANNTRKGYAAPSSAGTSTAPSS